MDETLFPQLPEDLSALTRAELEELRDGHLSVIDRIEAGDVDYTLDQLTAGVEALEQIKAQLDQLAADEAEAESTTADLLSRARSTLSADADAEGDAESDDANGDGEDDEDESEEAAADTEALAADTETDEAADEATDEQPTEVTAAATRRRRRPPAPPSSHAPVPTDTEHVTALRASAGIEGFETGEVIDSLPRLADALGAAERQFTARQGSREKVIVASARIQYPEDRQLLDRGDSAGNGEKIRAVVGPRATGFLPGTQTQARVASGGLCAPLTPVYDLPILSDADTPVWDSLAKFQSTRGGIQFPTPLGLADARGAITRVTMEDDAEGGTFAAKACLVIDCDPFQEAVIDAIAACVQHGNIGARAWPERVANLAELVDVAHAEETEIGLLNALSAGSTTVNADAEYGASATLIRTVLLAAAGYRSRNRMRPDRTLRAYFPSWTIDMFVADIVSGQFDRFDRSQAGVEALLRSYRIEPTFYMDSADGLDVPQVFDAQADGAITPWPIEVVFYLFAEGTWIGLDMGRLDLGIVRDSVLNETNDFQTFMETFIGIAKTGVESIEVTTTICPDGTVAAPAEAIACPTA